MHFSNAALLLASLLASTTVAMPLTERQSGQSCTDGNLQGTCSDGGFCDLFKPPNELESKIVPGQCGVEDNTPQRKPDQDPAGFEGQACTNGNFDGTCGEGGFCDMFKPPNEALSEIVPGQCGVADQSVEEEPNEDPAQFEGQDCTDGNFDGVCEADGFCNMFKPPNEQVSKIVRGQCGIAGGN